MERRELLKMMALTFGASVALPESAFAKLGEPLDVSKLKFFNAEQRALVGAISETIIPRTDTPGALDAGVPQWLELIVQDCLDADAQKLMLDGLVEIERRATNDLKKPYAQLSVEQQIELLESMQATKGGIARKFIGQFKELVKFTYVNSEVGGTQALEWILVPGRWEPAMELKPGMKVYV
jgi:gluconate 2-dehydrogenase gamma chain